MALLSPSRAISRPRYVGLALGVFFLALCGVIAVLPGCGRPAPSHNAPTGAGEDEYTGPPLFDDVTEKSGVAFTYHNGEEAGNFAIIESLGGGVALVDYDQDGLLDIFLPGGGHYRGKQVLGHPCKLYRNLGGLKFEDVTAKVGLDRIDFPYSHGAAAFDFDCDGWPDILITGYNRLVLLHNISDAASGRRFEDVTRNARLDDHLWSTSAAWGDLDGDGYPEIYVAHYGNWGFDTNHPTDCTYDGKTRDVCQPSRFKPLPHSLYRNNRDGTFTDISSASKLLTNGKGIGALMVDLNNDGRPEIYAANDTDDNFLYMNRGKLGEIALEEAGKIAGVARDERGRANGSMGVDATDYLHSGLASIFVTNYENELPALYKNKTRTTTPLFTYDTINSGIAAIGGNYVSWGTGFFDYDHDGWDDILIVSGHAIRYPTKIDRRQKPVLLHNEAGTFKPTTNQGGAYFRAPHNARGAAFGDLDNDGKIDLVISHLNEPVVILRNVAPTEGRHWLGIELTSEKNHDMVGARVVFETAGGRQSKFAKGGGSYASTNDRRMLLGLGGDEQVKRLTVYWPSGRSQEFTNLSVDAYWQLKEGEMTPVKREHKK